MAKTDFSTGTDGQSVHARTTADADKSQVFVLGTDGSNAVLDPATLATQATLAAVLAKITADPATQTTLAAILAKIIASPATEATLGTVATNTAKPDDQATTLTNGRKTSTTVGTAVALRSTLACKWVQVTALVTNTARVYVGGSGVLATAGSQTGTPLSAGESTTVPIADAATVFMDVLTSGEGVTFVVGS